MSKQDHVVTARLTNLVLMQQNSVNFTAMIPIRGGHYGCNVLS